MNSSTSSYNHPTLGPALTDLLQRRTLGTEKPSTLSKILNSSSALPIEQSAMMDTGPKTFVVQSVWLMKT